nr:hypothetical protein CFP56_04901 [Quercus suber]
MHALWSCPKPKEVWTVHFASLKNEARECSTFLEVFHICLEKAHPTNLFAMLAFQIWFRRNKLRMGEKVADLKMINSMARDALQEFQQANTTPPKPPLPKSPPYGSHHLRSGSKPILMELFSRSMLKQD